MSYKMKCPKCNKSEGFRQLLTIPDFWVIQLKVLDNGEIEDDEDTFEEVGSSGDREYENYVYCNHCDEEFQRSDIIIVKSGKKVKKQVS